MQRKGAVTFRQNIIKTISSHIKDIYLKHTLNKHTISTETIPWIFNAFALVHNRTNLVLQFCKAVFIHNKIASYNNAISSITYNIFRFFPRTDMHKKIPVFKYVRYVHLCVLSLQLGIPNVVKQYMVGLYNFVTLLDLAY